MNKIIEQRGELEAKLLGPLVKPVSGYNIVMAVLGIIVLSGLFSWVVQIKEGLSVTGLSDGVSWGLYIASFTFFVGTSLAGTVISAILRITGNHWQAPVTRIAEVITGAALIGAAAMIVVDMGRPERLFNVYIYGRMGSPLIWDVISITTYLTGSLIYLYLPMIPDFAVCRDRLKNSVSSFRHRVYSILALGWQDTPAQKQKLEKLLNIMAIIIIPVAVSVHSVTAWIYAMTFRPGWESAILAPYFVVSAFAGGIAMVIIVTTVYRRIFNLQKFLPAEHYSKLAKLLLGLMLVYAYFSIAELLPGGYKLEGHEQEYLELLFIGKQAVLFWSSVIGGILVPVLLLSWSKTRTVPGITLAAILITVAMWIKKGFLLVVPSMQVPLMPFVLGEIYRPSWTEWSINIAGFAGFLLLITLFFRFIPAITIWEVAGNWEEAAEESSGGRKVFSKLQDMKGGA